MAAIAITTRAAAEERPTEWEAFGGAPCRAARLDCSRRCEAYGDGGAKSPTTDSKVGSRGCYLGGNHCIGSSTSGVGAGGKRRQVVAFREAFGNKDEGVILGVNKTETP